MANHRRIIDNTADYAELSEIERRAAELDAERRELTSRRRRLADRLRQRKLKQERAA